MHTTLTLRTNVTAIIVSGLVTVVISVLTQPFPTVALMLSVLFGVAAGYLQSKSVTTAPAAFRSAQTTLEVRRALMSTTAGKRAIYAQWILFPLLFVSALRVGNPFGMISGYALFMCARDLVALKSVMGLAEETNPVQ